MVYGIGALFIGYVAFVAACIALLLSRYLPTNAILLSLGGLGAWLVYGGVLGYAGVIGDASLRPPGPALRIHSA